MVRVLSSGFSRYKIGVSYDGMYFSGWISQKFNFNGFRELSPSCIVKPSVTEILLLGLNKLVGVDNYENYKGSSRTDAGVHAVRNYFQVDIRDSCRLNSTAVVMGLNQKLNSYLKMRSDCAVFITDASLQTADFDAHALATGRVYLYRIQCPSTDNHLMRSQGSIFGKHRSWWISKPLDIDLMREAASYLVGEKDFSSFRAAGCDSPSPVKTLNMISIQRANDFQCPSNIDGHNFHNLIRDGTDLITVTVSGKSFLRSMVRNIVGTLTEVGLGHMTIDQFKLLTNKKSKEDNRCPAAPRCGLFLLDVLYDDKKD